MLYINKVNLHMRLAFGMLFLCVLGACSTGPRVVNHSFGFDKFADSPDIHILDYHYGTYAMTRAPSWRVVGGNPQQQMSVIGGMPVGDILYVQWRINKTGEILEDTVDLKSRLPYDIEGKKIYFVIKEKQLNVYLITKEKRPAGWPDYGKLGGYGYRKAYLIYPENHAR